MKRKQKRRTVSDDQKEEFKAYAEKLIGEMAANLIQAQEKFSATFAAGFIDGLTGENPFENESLAWCGDDPKEVANASAIRMLDHFHGKGVAGRVAGLLMALIHSLGNEDSAMRDSSGGEGNAASADYEIGIAGGMLVRKLVEGMSSHDGGFFRVLGGMLDRGLPHASHDNTPVGIALLEKVKLEMEGVTPTKKEVREAAEIERARRNLDARGIEPTPESIRRERDLSRVDWKREFKKHDDLNSLRPDKGGRPPTRKQGAKN